MLQPVENIQSLFRIPESTPGHDMEYVPHLLLEAKIDFSDVRTGFRESYEIFKILAIPEKHLEPLWDEAAALDVALQELQPDPPESARFRQLPGHVDGPFLSRIEIGFIQYLLHAFSVTLFRNYSLGMYSSSGESRKDFIIRCIEQHQGPMCREFDSMHEIFKRKLEQLRQKYLGEESSEDIARLRWESRNRELFAWTSDRISALFLRTEFSIQRLTPPLAGSSRVHELEERLHALHFEAQDAVTRILDAYEDKAKSVDAYILHPTMKDIHCTRIYVLWMPVGTV